MSTADGVNLGRRRFLTATATAVGGVGAAFVAVPFLKSWTPSERAKAAGAPVEADISKLAEGQIMTVEWRGKPVWVVHRSKAMLDALPALDGKMSDPKSEMDQQPAYAKNEFRSIKPEYLVLVGICTHLGCSPTFRPDLAPADLGAEWKGGFFCPCHGSRFDLAGRVYSGVPAPKNMVVPPYKYLSDTRILVGVGAEAA
ncbi:ubiquinol-cytochrome c reductase iron-sulfur subunit [Plasticicumulans sp.]|uniref:ubiquinol-cytochrome c reductase iron-sulfur subunit n=1 Tax=Plasticicumulans sp. TaxID=2307179 RepID=UPI000FB8D5FE|nr:ubiquinol-cytochrome c reductase iron-sulfur subunit [Plasticicumulans sp.]MBS0602931.1 ubiquinol-cytochrome c reductase iron-sulfur subunit [Pseudomonadota bacterium]RTL03577.1 MAG: ubiquinol-cytochrome c reductase iron-sulfur subunit [Xanthomonadales bacterium]HMV39058.1 ubiquinol-cytochrome c reductase iron-sulfur subunit [Plasticicumulans sp.]HMW28104.1 ubiquinol-cytochrome c reductase iron-sulfur subunit [Plasticicumulans sp.]HMW40843.1 ubiquinol-cytochrome c reductase iron-sulfur subu